MKLRRNTRNLESKEFMKTQHALTVALKEMMASQPLNTISVLELATKCGISRKTFYYHYHDIYDLLTQLFLEEKVPNAANAESFNDLVVCVFKYYKENEAFIDATLNSAGKELFSEFIYNIFYSGAMRFINKLDVDRVLSLNTKKAIARFYAYGYSSSEVYYLSTYKHKSLEGLVNTYMFLDKKAFNLSVSNAIKMAKKDNE